MIDEIMNHTVFNGWTLAFGMMLSASVVSLGYTLISAPFESSLSLSIIYFILSGVCYYRAKVGIK